MSAAIVHGSSWLRRTLVTPLVRMLRRGASPKRLAWSLAIGYVIGINPILGSTTVLTLAVAHFAKLNHSAAQIGTQTAYPAQLLLLLPFLRIGSSLFRSAPMSMQAAELLAMARSHPWLMVRSLWTWEWHALVVWALLAALLTPALAVVLEKVLARTLSDAAG